MPTTCATYPLSELWTTKYPAKGNQQQQTRKEFYSMDIANCEGVNAKGAKKRTVDEFATQQDLPARVEDWDWFMALSIEVGRKRFDEKLLQADSSGKCVDTFLSLLNGIWYDFDSIPLTREEVVEIDEAEKLQPGRQQAAGLVDLLDSETATHADEWRIVKAAITHRTRLVCQKLEQICDFSLRGKKFDETFRRFIADVAAKGITLRQE